MWLWSEIVLNRSLLLFTVLKGGVCVSFVVVFFFYPLLSLSPSSSLKHGLLWSLNYVRCQKAYFIPVLVDSVKTCVSKQRA